MRISDWSSDVCSSDLFELGFDFEARSTLLTQRAINAIDAVPPAIGAIRAALPKNTPDNLRVQLDHLQSQITTYGVTPTPTNEPEIRQSIKALDEFAAGKSEALVKSTHDLGVLIDQLLGDKGDLVHMYREFLSRPTGEQLQAVEQAYLGWYEAQQIGRAHV